METALQILRDDEFRARFMICSENQVLGEGAYATVLKAAILRDNNKNRPPHVGSEQPPRRRFAALKICGREDQRTKETSTQTL